MPYTPEQMAAEKRLRIRLALAAYDYEMMHGALGIMTDLEFDYKCKQVNLDCPTGNSKMDDWFRNNFDPSTGQWVWNHPDTIGLARIWHQLKRAKDQGGLHAASPT